MGKGKVRKRETRKRNTKVHTKIKLEPGCFPPPVGDAHCCSQLDDLHFLYQMSPRSPLERRMERNE